MLAASYFEGAIAALRINVDSEAICITAAKVLGQCTAAGDYAQKYREFGRCDGIAVLLEILRAHPASTRGTDVALILRNCIFYCPDYAILLSSSEDLAVVSTVFNVALPHADRVRAVASLIEVLSRGDMDTRHRLGSAGIARQLVVALKRHGQTNADVALKICGAIANLATVSENKAQFMQEGAVSVLNNVLRGLPAAADAAAKCQQAIVALT